MGSEGVIFRKMRFQRDLTVGFRIGLKWVGVQRREGGLERVLAVFGASLFVEFPKNGFLTFGRKLSHKIHESPSTLFEDFFSRFVGK